MAEPGNTPNDEIVQLRARIAELETELRARDTVRPTSRASSRERTDERARRNLTDALKHASDRSMDDTQRLVRGVTLAVVEQLHLTADVVAGFAEDIERRNTGSDSEAVKRLPADVSSSLAAAIERSLEIPERVVDRFHSTYSRTDADDRPVERA